MLVCSYAINMGAYLSDCASADHNMNMHHNVGKPKRKLGGACLHILTTVLKMYIGMVLAWIGHVWQTRSGYIHIDVFKTFGQTHNKRLDAFKASTFKHQWSSRHLRPLIKGRLV
jgi:hypothetical protein